MHDIAVLERRLERERRARREAESLLEQKSREVYDANEELRALADRTQAIVDTAAEGILTINARGTIASFNPAAERIFGYQAAEVIGRDVSTLIPAPDGAPRDEHLRHCLDEAIVGASHEMVGLRKDGCEFPIDLAVSEVEVGEGRILTALIRDMTHRKQLETQLAHAQKMESVGQLAAGIAHEINTPIQYVGDNARFLDDAFQDMDRVFQQVELLLKACQSGTPAAELIEQTKQAAEEADLVYLRDEVPQAIQQSIEGAERVATIVRAMKEFSHPGVEEKSAIDLNQAIESTITISRNEWKYVAEVETSFDPALPLVECLPGELNQAILNLIVNAAHAIEKARQDDSQPLGSIAVSTKLHGAWAEIRIADTGTGIPVDVRPKVFDPFFTTKPVGKGTGQGLAITYSVVVEKHGGAINFQTEMGRGTTFIVRLPLRDQRVSQQE